MQAKTSLTQTRPARRVVRKHLPKAEGDSKPARRRPGARLPGMKGGAVLADEAAPKPYKPKMPCFPLTRAEVLAKCHLCHYPPVCAGEVMALMDLMEHGLCTMFHLHEISDVGYATIHDFLNLECFPGTPIRARLMIALNCEPLEFQWIAHWDLKAEKEEEGEVLSVLHSFPHAGSFVIRHSSFVIRHSSFVIRHSSFVIRHSAFILSSLAVPKILSVFR
ncbi:MAG: hypothetical protein ABL974_02090 [Prosthecobacter sp.]